MSEDVGVTRPDLGAVFDAHVAAEFVPPEIKPSSAWTRRT
jgi:hypothetical protein